MTEAVHRYPPQTLYGDYVRAGVGLTLTGLPLVALDLNLWVGIFLGICAALFALFGARTAQRHTTTFVIDETGISSQGPLGTALRWDDLKRFKLRYFSTKRDRTGGWMQLVLAGGGRSIKLESTLHGFDEIAERAAAAARANHLALDDTTLDNLDALGLDTGWWRDADAA